MATTFSCERCGSSFGAIICPSSFMILQHKLFAPKPKQNEAAVPPVAKERLGMLTKLHAIGVTGKVRVCGRFGDLYSPAVLFRGGESTRKEATAP